MNLKITCIIAVATLTTVAGPASGATLEASFADPV